MPITGHAAQYAALPFFDTAVPDVPPGAYAAPTGGAPHLPGTRRSRQGTQALDMPPDMPHGQEPAV